MSETAIQEALSAYLKGTKMEFGSAMFAIGFKAGQVAALSEAADEWDNGTEQGRWAAWAARSRAEGL